jgi:type IV secretory pathway VirB10-like protein
MQSFRRKPGSTNIIIVENWFPAFAGKTNLSLKMALRHSLFAGTTKLGPKCSYGTASTLKGEPMKRCIAAAVVLSFCAGLTPVIAEEQLPAAPVVESAPVIATPSPDAVRDEQKAAAEAAEQAQQQERERLQKTTQEDLKKIEQEKKKAEQREFKRIEQGKKDAIARELKEKRKQQNEEIKQLKKAKKEELNKLKKERKETMRQEMKQLKKGMN